MNKDVVEQFQVRYNKLYDQVVKITEKEELNTYKKTVNEFQRLIDIDKLSKYDQKSIVTKLNRLDKIFLMKSNEIGMEKFRFDGRPEAPKETVVKQPISQKEDISIESNEMGNLTNQVSTISGNHLLLTNVDQCIIRVQCKTININQVKDSIMEIASEGPIFIHNMRNSVLLVNCHQLRLHGIENCTIIHQVSSRRIIMENCSLVKFGNLMGHEILVDDFNWPSTETNPHFTTVLHGESETIANKIHTLYTEGAISKEIITQLVNNR